MAARGQEDLTKGSEWSGGPRKGPRGVWRLYRRTERGREDLWDCSEGSGGPTGGP